MAERAQGKCARGGGADFGRQPLSDFAALMPLSGRVQADPSGADEPVAPSTR